MRYYSFKGYLLMGLNLGLRWFLEAHSSSKPLPSFYSPPLIAPLLSETIGMRGYFYRAKSQ